MDKTKKYVFTIRSLTGGGAERVVSVLASHMAEDGYDVGIICYGKTNHDYVLNAKVNLWVMPNRPNSIVGKASRIFDMRRLLKKIKPDVVIPFVGTVLFVSYLACKSLHIPFIRTVRISPWMEEGGKIQARIRDMLNYKAIAIMVQNEEQIDYFPERLRGKVFVVPNPISDEFLDCKKTEYAPEIKRIISVGRLTKQKNHELLIRAFSEISADNNIRLDIYGTGPEKDHLKELIKNLNIEHKCYLLGRSDTISNELMASDLFVMTSDFEGMPNALMEAMAIGIPCISSDCKTGPRTLIENGKDGFLFETGKIDDLKQKIRWCIENAEKMPETGKAARQKILTHYSYEKVYDYLINMINNI